GSADGFSPYSQPINAYVGPPQPPTPNQIINVSGPSTGPFVITLTWNQNNPNANAVTKYIVQKSVDGGAFSTLAQVLGGTNQLYVDGPLAAGHVYTYQVAAVYNGITTAYSGTVYIAFPVGAEVAVPAQVLAHGNNGVPYFQQLYAGFFTVLPDTDTELTSYGVGPYTWSMLAGTLPTGLALDPTSGAI